MIAAYQFRRGQFVGTEKKFTYEKYVSCDTCGGSGSQGKGTITCKYCNGTGETQQGLGGFFSFRSTCGHCGGSGHVIKDKCRTCRGNGSLK